MSSLYPEQIASYFASISPLSAKIIADIQCVEESVKLDEGLSYNEKSKIIDKHLIYDVIRRHKERMKDKEESEEDVPVSEIYYDDPELDQDHVSALLTSVYPRRPEKYVYDENSFYVDEHSEPFSYCTQSQAQYCGLEKLVKSLPPPPTLARMKSDSKSRTHHHHHHHHHHRDKPAPPPPTQQRRSTEIVSDEYDPAQKSTQESAKSSSDNKKPKKTGIAAFGVPLMGLSMAPSNPKPSEKKQRAPARATAPSQPPSSDLPKQVPNSDLIAELQAKLKMNKEKGAGNGLKRTTSKVNKPKAPPPPPPKNTAEVRPSEASSSQVPLKSTKDSTTVVIPDVHNSCTTSKKKPLEQGVQPADEFCVDISSPCRIATPKTGFDFLDNW